MIFEYAVEPELVATWGARDAYRYFVSSFGLGTKRLVSRFPAKWRQAVLRAADPLSEIEKARVIALVERLSEVTVRRPGSSYDGNIPWLPNAEIEHARRAFNAILATANPNSIDVVLTPEKLDPGTLLWDDSPESCAVPRTSAHMSSSVKPLLLSARRIAFIDPHFGPDRSRCWRAMKVFLETASSRPSADPSEVVLEIHSSSAGDLGTDSFFMSECERRLARSIPRGTKLRIVRWTQRSGGEQLHDRFILTDLGGVEFTVGLDESRADETTGVLILSRDLYAKRWHQYLGETPAFDLGFEGFVDGAG